MLRRRRPESAKTGLFSRRAATRQRYLDSLISVVKNVLRMVRGLAFQLINAALG